MGHEAGEAGNADPITYLGRNGKQHVAVVATDTLMVYSTLTLQPPLPDAAPYFFSAGYDVAGPMPHTWITAGSFLAPS